MLSVLQQFYSCLNRHFRHCEYQVTFTNPLISRKKTVDTYGRHTAAGTVVGGYVAAAFIGILETNTEQRAVLIADIDMLCAHTGLLHFPQQSFACIIIAYSPD